MILRQPVFALTPYDSETPRHIILPPRQPVFALSPDSERPVFALTPYDSRQPVFALTPYDSETTSLCSNSL